jgi:hypothetical protein
MLKNLFILFVFLLVFSSAVADAKPWPLPITASAAQVNLAQTNKGELILSWIERKPKGHRLQMSTYANALWSKPQTIAEGDNWFVNWADFPSITALPNGTLWAHYLVKRSAGTYAYDVMLKQSKDKGKTWSKPILVHNDGTESEHGFVSLWPWSSSKLAVAWLDGRHTIGSSSHDHSASAGKDDSGKAMTLRAAVFDSNGKKTNEWQLDQRTCDCCQTDAAITSKGPIVIYRDRDTNEIRDIHTSRYLGKAWTVGKAVARDNWLMPACPVNGPAIAANQNSVWAAWYTAANDKPSVRLAHSNNSGESFQQVKTITSGAHIQGHVDVAADKNGAWLLWSEEQQSQTLWLQHFDLKMHAASMPIKISQLQGRGHATGFARMQKTAKGLFIVWTDVVGGKPVLQGAQIQ